jgi:transposase
MDTAEYQRRLLTQADAATEKGDMAQLLRREGLYAAPLAGWRGERESALAKALTQKRGPEPSGNPRAGEKERRRQPNQPWEEELGKAEIMIDIPNKVALLFGKRRPLIPESENCCGRRSKTWARAWA